MSTPIRLLRLSDLMSARCLAGGVMAIALVASSAVVAVETASPPDGALVLEFPRYNTEYRGLVTELQAIDAGAIQVELTSPEHRLNVLGHRLSLWPGTGGRHDARLEATFQGGGDLVAEVKVGAFPARLDDKVTIIEQTRTVDAVVRIAADAEGYMVTFEDGPDFFEVEIESELAKGLVSLCGGFSFLLGSRAACDGLEGLLTHPRVPMPEPGTEFLVHRDYLTEAERGRIDAFVGISRAAATAPGL